MAKKKQPPKKHSQEGNQKISTNNSFDILNQLPEVEEVENPHKKNIQSKDKGKIQAAIWASSRANPRYRLPY
jgi:hypothetical protein